MQAPLPMSTRSAQRFVRDVFRSVTWRALLLTQSLGLALTIFRWLEQFDRHAPQYPLLLAYVIGQSFTALLVLLAALAGDQAVRRGWPVWRTVVVGLTASAAIAAVAMSGLRSAFAIANPRPNAELIHVLQNFLDVCSYWGMAMMVFLNNRSASRMLEGVRATELERVQVERRLLSSRLAAAETQIDPGSVLRQLARVRDSYAAGSVGADEKLEALIASLRATVAGKSPEPDASLAATSGPGATGNAGRVRP